MTLTALSVACSDGTLQTDRSKSDSTSKSDAASDTKDDDSAKTPERITGQYLTCVARDADNSMQDVSCVNVNSNGKRLPVKAIKSNSIKYQKDNNVIEVKGVNISSDPDFDFDFKIPQTDLQLAKNINAELVLKSGDTIQLSADRINLRIVTLMFMNYLMPFREYCGNMDSKILQIPCKSLEIFYSDGQDVFARQLLDFFAIFDDAMFAAMNANNDSIYSRTVNSKNASSNDTNVFLKVSCPKQSPDTIQTLPNVFEKIRFSRINKNTWSFSLDKSINESDWVTDIVTGTWSVDATTQKVVASINAPFSKLDEFAALGFKHLGKDYSTICGSQTRTGVMTSSFDTKSDIPFFSLSVPTNDTDPHTNKKLADQTFKLQIYGFESANEEIKISLSQQLAAPIDGQDLETDFSKLSTYAQFLGESKDPIDLKLTLGYKMNTNIDKLAAKLIGDGGDRSPSDQLNIRLCSLRKDNKVIDGLAELTSPKSLVDLVGVLNNIATSMTQSTYAALSTEMKSVFDLIKIISGAPANDACPDLKQFKIE